jgi:uncharacterized damage-inducible protein DinB
MKKDFVDSIQTLLLRDLGKLEAEISQYRDEATIWKIEKDIKNSAGTLCLHLCGNLQHYFGAVLGKSGYKRNRDLEFSARNISKEKLLQEIAAAKKAVELVMPSLTETQLLGEYPENVFGKPMTTLFFMVHLSAHLSYHLGQVNYHRRLLTPALS